MEMSRICGVLLSTGRLRTHVCLVLLVACFWHRPLITDGSDTRAAVADLAESGDLKDNVKLKIGALFDLRARHFVDAFQAAVDSHNSEELQQKGPDPSPDHPHLRHGPPDDVISIIFEPVITFVDVTDSFAVSNAMCDLIAHDVIAIVGITNASSLPTIQSYSATFHVPFLSLGSSQNVTSTTPFQLSLRPPVMAAVVDLLQHQGCSSALYMYDSDEGLMRIQDLFQAINIRELYLELDVRRIGDRAHVTEISKIIGSLHPRREICLVLDVERLDAKAVISVISDGAPTVKDVILVTLDAEKVFSTITDDAELLPSGFNISGLQLVPSSFHSTPLHFHPHLHPHQSFHRWSHPTTPSEERAETLSRHKMPQQLNRGLNLNQRHSPQQNPPDPVTVPKRDMHSSNGHSRARTRGERRSAFNPNSGEPAQVGGDEAAESGPSPDSEEEKEGVPSSSETAGSCEALIVDCLKILTAALADLWDTLGDVFQSSHEVSQEDMSIKCTNFVVEKKQYGADLMEALRLVHIHGETRYISFDTAGKREDYTLSILSVRAGATIVRNEGEWSSVSGLTSHAWSRHGVRSYTIFGNMSGQTGRRVLIGVME